MDARYRNAVSSCGSPRWGGGGLCFSEVKDLLKYTITALTLTLTLVLTRPRWCTLEESEYPLIYIVCMVSLQGYTGANPMPPGHGREQPLYGSYPYGDYIQGYPQGGYLPAAGETRGGSVRGVRLLY